MILLRWVPTKDGVRRSPNALGYAYRIVDQQAWDAWVTKMVGRPAAELEVVNRTLRVRDHGLSARAAEVATESAKDNKPVPAPTAKVPALPQSKPTTVATKLATPAPRTEPVKSAPQVHAGATATVASTLLPKPTASTESVKDRVLALVAEKTGYPVDMLDLDLDLEADLGVDTVKQAEVFAAIREAYRIARDDQIKLRDYPTLARVIRFVNERRPDAAVTASPVVAAAEQQETTKLTAPVSESVAAPSGAGDAVKERILDLAVEKTGYPRDMLDLDLDLEADLGVDTVKQAEMFAAIRETYNIPRDENRKLRDYPTLAHVVRFVYEKRPDLVPAVASATATAEVHAIPKPTVAPEATVAAPIDPSQSGPESDTVKDRILALMVEKTGYPQDMLDLDLDLEADLGVDTVKQAEMFAAIREIYNIPRDENRKLRDYPTLAHVIRFVYENRPDLAGTGEKLPAKAEVTPVVEVTANGAAPPAQATDVHQPTLEADSVKDRILALAVEKTGYPQDMLDLDLDLEADLGVDTVKQAEMFAAIREIYNIPRDENRKLRDYPTLAHVIRFVFESRPDLAAATTGAPAQEVDAQQAEAVEPPANAVATQAAPVASDESIKEKVLQIVAEKTGYPPDMLDLDLDLEADFGIDTVKQAEMFAAVRAAYNIPRDEALKLRDFPTLAHVIQFAQKGMTRVALVGSATSATLDSGRGAVTPNAKTQRRPVASFDAANRIPRRVPVPTLRPPLGICKPTGVKLGPGSRVLVASDAGGVAETLALRLEEDGVETLRLDAAAGSDTICQQLGTWLAAGPVQGVYWLPALDSEKPIQSMDLASWHEALRVRVKALYATMRRLYGQVAAPGTFLVSATRLGGQHGYDEAGAFAPMGGAVVGFTKAYKRERPEALVKVVDFEADRSAFEVAELLIDETLRDPGAVEVGYKSGLRWTVGLRQLPVDDGQPGVALNESSVFVVTGAAGSIVSAITADLADCVGRHILSARPGARAGFQQS